MFNIFLLLSIFSLNEIKAQDRFTFEFIPGISGVLPMPLTVYQNGNKVASFTAHYKTK